MPMLSNRSDNVQDQSFHTFKWDTSHGLAGPCFLGDGLHLARPLTTVKVKSVRQRISALRAHGRVAHDRSVVRSRERKKSPCPQPTNCSVPRRSSHSSIVCASPPLVKSGRPWAPAPRPLIFLAGAEAPPSCAKL